MVIVVLVDDDDLLPLSLSSSTEDRCAICSSRKKNPCLIHRRTQLRCKIHISLVSSFESLLLHLCLMLKSFMELKL